MLYTCSIVFHMLYRNTKYTQETFCLIWIHDRLKSLSCNWRSWVTRCFMLFSSLLLVLLTLWLHVWGRCRCTINMGPIRRLPDGIAWWIRICMYFSALWTLIIVTESPTSFAEMQPQTFKEPPPCFTVACRHSLVYRSPALWRTNCNIGNYPFLLLLF